MRHPNSTRAHPYPSFASAVRSCQRAFSTDSSPECSSTESSSVRQNNSVVVTHEQTENFLKSVSSQLHCAQQQQKSRCTSHQYFYQNCQKLRIDGIDHLEEKTNNNNNKKKEIEKREINCLLHKL